MKKITTTEMPTMMETLAMARSLLVERYQEQKARCVTHWQMLNEYAWSTDGVIMACADLPEYPTMEEILALARHLTAYFEEQSMPEEYIHEATTSDVVVHGSDAVSNVAPEMGNVASEIGNVYIGGLTL